MWKVDEDSTIKWISDGVLQRIVIDSLGNLKEASVSGSLIGNGEIKWTSSKGDYYVFETKKHVEN